MPTGKTCGNCQYFIRIKAPLFQQGGRNGLCDIFDYNCNTDSSYAKECPKYKKLPTKQSEKLGMDDRDLYYGY